MTAESRVTTATPLSEEAKAEAIRRSGGTETGRVMKVLYVDDEGHTVGEWASQQIPENPFGGKVMAGIMEPPYKLEQLIYLAEQHPVHSSAIEQKTVDICGTGWDFALANKDDSDQDDEDEASLKAKQELRDWFESLAPDDESMQEILQAGWEDVETCGWGLLEVVRNPVDGKVKRLYQVPGHTVRAHKDGVRFVQMRGTQRVWFKKWGAVRSDGEPYEVDAKTGSLTNVKEPASDLLVVKKKSRRSTWYGIPSYIGSIGYLTLALSARDDNLLYFNNRREPRWAIILSNLDDNPKIEEDIRRAFTVDLKMPHRNIIIPIAGAGEINFQQLSSKNGPEEGSFIGLAEHCDKKILIGHRVPAERLANIATGPLGGNVADEANRVYKEGVVAPSQHLYETRLNRFITVEYAKETDATFDKDGKPPILDHVLKLDDMDLDEDKAEAEYVMDLFKGDVITLGETRKKLGLGPLMKRPKDPAKTVVLDQPDAPDGAAPPKPNDTQKAAPPAEDPKAPAKPAAPAPAQPGAPVPPPLPPPTKTVPAEFDPKVDPVESEYNDYLYTELPGVGKGQDASSGGPLPPTPGSTDGEDFGKSAVELALLRADVAESIHQGKKTQRVLQELADKEE